jgi:hypothetical protein
MGEVAAVPALRDCKACLHCPRYGRELLQPKTEFRPSPAERDGLYYLCRQCEQQLRVDARQGARAMAREREASEALAIMAKAPMSVTTVNAADLLVQRLGGLGAWIDEQVFHYEQLAARLPGSKEVMRFHELVHKIIDKAQKHRAPDEDVSQMSDEELEAEINQRIKVLSVAPPGAPPGRQPAAAEKPIEAEIVSDAPGGS